MAMSNAALETALKASLQRLVTALANKTAPNSEKLDGKTLEEITTIILAGKAAFAGEADNALAVGGKDLATLEAERASALTAAIDALRTELEGSIGGVTKESIGLGNVVNYGVATEEEALAGATDKYVTAMLAQQIAQAKIDEIVGAAPETLNTLNEIAAALNNDPDIINTLMTEIGTKETPAGAQAKADAAVVSATEAAALDATAKVDAAKADLQTAIDGKLDATAQAVDSALLGGQTAEQIITAAQAGVDMSNVVEKGDNVDGNTVTVGEEQVTLSAAIGTIKGDLSSAVSTLEGSVAAEASARDLADQALDTKIDNAVQVLEGTKVGRTDNIDTNTVTQGEGEAATQVALSTLIAQLQSGIAAAGDATALQALQDSFNAFVAAKATGAEVIAGTDDVKYVTALAAKAAIDAAVAELVGTAPEALNTINELAAALNNDPDVINTLMTQIGEKQSAAQVQTAIDAALVPVNAAIDTKLDATAQAADSAKLNGKTQAELTSVATDLDDVTGVAGTGKFADAGQVAVKLAAQKTASDTNASDIEALVLSLTESFDTAAAALEPAPAV